MCNGRESSWLMLDTLTLVTTTTTAKFAIITGASSGLGLHLAKRLHVHGGYSLILACRNRSKAERAVQEVLALSRRDATGVSFMEVAIIHSDLCPNSPYTQLDLTRIDSIRRFVGEFASICAGRNLHLLVNNAGVMYHPYHVCFV